MADAPDYDEDFHPAKLGDNPIWLGCMKYIRADLAEAMVAAAVAAALAAQIEKDAKVAEIYAGDHGLKPAKGWPQEYADAWETGGSDHALAIAAAIRAQGDK